ncbi:MAG: MFS transporter [Leptospiraceae bacterium]|nr:MFS transporter [Leptospiraceae bacterium]MDW7975675.1 MFS transporter [Leptospiraceae bacterium]
MNSEQEALIQKRKQYAWWIFFSVSIPYVLVYFHRVAPAVVSQQLMSFFQITGAEFGNLSAIYFYIYTIMQVPAGVLADSIGPKRIIFFGSLLSGVGSILFGLSEVYSFALFGRLLVGLGVSVIFVSILKLNQNWFDLKSFSLMSGITIFLGNLGAFFATYPLAYFTDLFGWQTTFIFIGVMGVLTGFLAFFVVVNHPKEKNFPLPEGLSDTPPLTLKEANRGLFLVIRNPYTWLPFIAFFGIYGSLMVFQGSWGILYLMHNYSLEKIEASQYLMFLTFGLMVGGILQGNLAKRFRIKRLFFLNMLIFFLIFIVLGNFRLELKLLPYLFFLMGVVGSSFIFIWTLAKNVNLPELAGSATGIANMGGFLGAAVLQPLFGLILDFHWEGHLLNASRVYSFFAYQKAFLLLIGFLAISLLAIFFSKEHR